MAEAQGRSTRISRLIKARPEAVTFETGDPAFKGGMTIAITFAAAPGGTEVAFACTDLPPGLRPEDNEAGTRLSLERLARRFERLLRNPLPRSKGDERRCARPDCSRHPPEHDQVFRIATRSGA